MTTDRIRIIENYLSNNDVGFDSVNEEKFKNVLISMLDIIESNSDLDYKKLFTTYMKILKSKSSSRQNLKSTISFVSGMSRVVHKRDCSRFDKLVDKRCIC